MHWNHRLSRALFGFSHAEHPLTGVQRAKYDARVRELARGDRWGTALSMIPGLAGIAIVPVWVLLQKRVSFPLQMVAQVIFAIGVFTYLLWLLRAKHRRHGPRALRGLGFADICPRCAYDLSRHSGPEGRCPECGEAFSQFHPDRTWSTGPR